MTRVAAVDLGSNSTRLLVADVVDGRVDDLVRRTVVTGLGEGVDARRRLLPVPIARVRNVLSDYRREAEALGAERILAVATSAVRDAENGVAFLGEIEWSYGFSTRLLTGDEEAALTRRGVGALGDTTLLLDVGGGSTELSTSSFRRSIDVGSVRLTERHLHSDPPTGRELDAAAAEVRADLPPLAVDGAVGVAGTVAQLAVLARTDRPTLADVERLLDELTALPLEERRKVPGLDPARARVIDLLDGAALEAAATPAPLDAGAPGGAHPCC